MTLRKKILAIVLLVTAALTPLNYFLFSRPLLSRLERLQQDELHKKQALVSEGLRAEQTRLLLAAHELTHSAEVAEVLRAGRGLSLEKSLNESDTLRGICDVVLLFDHRSRLLFHSQSSDVPAEFAVKAAALPDTEAGILGLPHHTLIFVKRSVGSSAAGGTLVLARLMQQQLAAQLSRRLGLTVEFMPAHTDDVPADSWELLFQLLSEPLVVNHSGDGQSVSALTLLRDSAGKPAMVIKITDPSLALAQGRAGSQLMFIATMMSSLCLAGAILLFLERVLMARVLSLIRQVRGITADDESRVHIAGADELSAVGVEFNRMLETLRSAKASSDAKSLFLAKLNHELRTPLNGIMGIVHLLRSKGVEAKRERLLQIMDSCSQSLLDLVNQLLDFSKIEAGKISLRCEPFDPKDLVREVTDCFEAKSEEKGLKLEVAIADDVPDELAGDRGRTGQVLKNLVANAVKFTPTGGKIRVAVSAYEIGIKHALLAFSVSDTGIGIPAEARDEIFNMFSQLNPEREGAGLGLTISKELVQLMGGEIWVESEVGRGAIFSFTARFQMPAHRAVHQAPRPASAASLLQHKRILVVEDNHVFRGLLADLLKEQGAHVQLAGNGQEALELLEHSAYDLILMDCLLPVMDGYQAALRIREQEDMRQRRTPIVAVTANVLATDRQLCIDVGMDEYVAKPFAPAELYAVISNVLNRSAVPLQ